MQYSNDLSNTGPNINLYTKRLSKIIFTLMISQSIKNIVKAPSNIELYFIIELKIK